MRKITQPLVSGKPAKIPNLAAIIAKPIRWSSSRPTADNDLQYQGSRMKFANGVGKKLS